jgi:hypothetical protein
MKNLIIVFMTLISLCSYSQRDLNKMSYYFFIGTKDTVTYDIAEVTDREVLSNGITKDKLNYLKDFKVSTDQGGIVFDLNKNQEYKIRFKTKDKTIIVYTTPADIEPRHYSSVFLEFNMDEFIRITYDPYTEDYLAYRYPLPEYYH